MGRYIKRKLSDGQYEWIQEMSNSIHNFPLMPGKKLLVGSIFANDSAPQRKWLDLQLKYLRATTPIFEYIVLLYNKHDSYFSDRTEVIEAPKAMRNSAAHIEGLKHLLKHFQEVKEDYDYFLFLDSDAFPIRKDWLGILESRMKDKDVAVPIRFENLEQRLHASILFCKKQALSNLKFKSMNLGPDLRGTGRENDVCIGDYQDKFRSLVFPLLRSNQLQVNPLLCGIYYDIFYHHCCGSGRGYNMRGRDYWNHIAPAGTDPQLFTDELMNDPDAFIGNLTQWAPDMYVKVGKS